MPVNNAFVPTLAISLDLAAKRAYACCIASASMIPQPSTCGVLHINAPEGPVQLFMLATFATASAISGRLSRHRFTAGTFACAVSTAHCQGHLDEV